MDILRRLLVQHELSGQNRVVRRREDRGSDSDPDIEFECQQSDQQGVLCRSGVPPLLVGAADSRTIKVDTRSSVSYHSLAFPAYTAGDALFFDAFALEAAANVEMLVKVFLSGSLSGDSQGNLLRIPTGLPVVINVQKTFLLSPATLAAVRLNHFHEEFIAPDFLGIFVGSRLSTWENPWLGRTVRLLGKYSELVVEHMVNFLKKNKESSSLLYWNSDREFYVSLGYKILGLLKELAINYPVETKNGLTIVSENKDTLHQFECDVECCILFGLIAETENHLKLFFLTTSSKFLVDTVIAAHEEMADDDTSEEDFSGEEEMQEDEMSLASPTTKQGSPYMKQASPVPKRARKANSHLLDFLGKLENKQKTTVYSFCYYIKKSSWILWSELPVTSIHEFGNTQDDFKLPDDGTLSRQRSFVSLARKSGQDQMLMPRGSRQSIGGPLVPKEASKLQRPNIIEFMKVDFWAYNFTKHSIPFACLSNKRVISKLVSEQLTFILNKRELPILNADCERLFSKSAVNSFGKRNLRNILKGVVSLSLSRTWWSMISVWRTETSVWLPTS